MYCKNCNNEIGNDADFCRYCGNRVEADPLIIKEQKKVFTFGLTALLLGTIGWIVAMFILVPVIFLLEEVFGFSLELSMILTILLDLLIPSVTGIVLSAIAKVKSTRLNKENYLKNKARTGRIFANIGMGLGIFWLCVAVFMSLFEFTS